MGQLELLEHAEKAPVGLGVRPQRDAALWAPLHVPHLEFTCMLGGAPGRAGVRWHSVDAGTPVEVTGSTLKYAPNGPARTKCACALQIHACA